MFRAELPLSLRIRLLVPLHDLLRAVDRQGAAAALAASRGQIGDRATTSDDEDTGEWEDDEAKEDEAEESGVG